MLRLVTVLVLICSACSANLGVAAGKGIRGASGWHHCAAWTLAPSSGFDVRITQLKTRGVSCRRTRRVIRNFYSQPIGSSGSTIALGYGCYHRYSTLICEKEQRSFRWHERIIPSTASAAARSCGTISVTLSPGDTRYARHITTRRVACKQAKRLARAVTSDPGEGGIYLTFRCDGTSDQHGGGTITCRRGSKWVHWRY